MLEVGNFWTAAQLANGSATLALTSNGSALKTRSRLGARWFARFRVAENEEIAQNFVGALCRRYGRELTFRAMETTSYRWATDYGKPLRAREVRNVILLAENLEDSFNDDNQQSSARIGAGQVFAGDGRAGVSMLREKIEAVTAATRPLWALKGTARIVDQEAVILNVQEEIVARSRGGRHLVTEREIDLILTGVIQSELKSAYVAARNRALQALSLSPGAIAHEALVSALAAHRPPLDISPDDLTEGSVRTLEARLESAIVGENFPADGFDNADALKALASKVVDGFIDERREARAEVEALDLLDDVDGTKKAALLARVSRDSIPAQLIRQLGVAYNRVEKDLARLAHPLPEEHLLAPKQLQNSLYEIRDAISAAFEASGTRISTENQVEFNIWAWRFLLAPGGAQEAAAIHRRLAPENSLLRQVGEAAAWYAYRFPGSVEWERKFEGVHPSLNGKRIHDQHTRHQAASYSLLINALSNVLEEDFETGTNARPIACRKAPSDRAVATLRNLGIPFPAPNRVKSRSAGNEVLLSNTQIKEMDAEMRSHLTRSEREGTDAFGITKGCREYLYSDNKRFEKQKRELGSGRALVRYYIDSDKFLPQDPDAVAGALRNFCVKTDQDGNAIVDYELLAKISAMAQRATLDCVYAGCMDPNRPDLAIVNGDLKCATRYTAYRLSRNENGEVRLVVEEELRPYWYLPAREHTANGAAGEEQEGGGNPVRVPLSPTKSRFHTRVAMKFTPHSYNPVIDNVDIDYRLVKRVDDSEERPYIIRNPNAPRERTPSDASSLSLPEIYHV